MRLVTRCCLHRRTTAWAIERGCTEYDFLSGGEGYKDRWADGERTLVDLRVLADRPRVRWRRRLQRVKALFRRGQAASGSL